LLVSNHQSLLDIPLYMVYFHGIPIRFVAKDQLSRYVPMVSPMLRSQGHCFIPRSGSPRRAMHRLESFAHRTGERGQIPVIFPEGTRSRDGELGSFYPAGFRRLLETRSLPVVVCALDGAHKLAGLLGIFRHLRGASYRVKLLKLYDAPKSKEDMLRILGEARSLIQNQLHTWRYVPRGH
jgi:1-acyl-sn-glycerol-3-phosphate acyltransferase